MDSHNDDLLSKLFGRKDPAPQTIVKTVMPSTKEFMQRIASEWMKHEFPDKEHDYVFKNSKGRRCRVVFKIEML